MVSSLTECQSVIGVCQKKQKQLKQSNPEPIGTTTLIGCQKKGCFFDNLYTNYCRQHDCPTKHQHYIPETHTMALAYGNRPCRHCKLTHLSTSRASTIIYHRKPSARPWGMVLPPSEEIFDPYHNPTCVDGYHRSPMRSLIDFSSSLFTYMERNTISMWASGQVFLPRRMQIEFIYYIDNKRPLGKWNSFPFADGQMLSTYCIDANHRHNNRKKEKRNHPRDHIE